VLGRQPHQEFRASGPRSGAVSRTSTPEARFVEVEAVASVGIRDADGMVAPKQDDSEVQTVFTLLKELLFKQLCLQRQERRVNK